MARSSRAASALTRKRLVGLASEAFRRQGYAGVALRDLMADAGLSHGAFYAHFPSKEALFGEACTEAMQGTRARLLAQAASASPHQALEALVGHYLHPLHVAHPEMGCCLPALGGEAPRLGAEGQGPLQAALGVFQRDLAGLMGGDEGKAWAALATMVGGVLLARASGSEGQREAILEACRASVLASKGGQHGTP